MHSHFSPSDASVTGFVLAPLSGWKNGPGGTPDSEAGFWEFPLARDEDIRVLFCIAA